MTSFYSEEELKKLAYGNKIIFTGKYEEPADRRNYKGFSYKEYLKTEGIYGIVKVEFTNVKTYRLEIM